MSVWSDVPETLGYEAASQMKAVGIGITTSLGIGGDPINGMSHKDAFRTFRTGSRYQGSFNDR